MTHELIERMVGHRTRLAQEDPGQRHESEDRLLERYVDASRAMDRVAAILEGLVPRGWLVLGLLWLGYRLLFSTGSLALALASVLLARRAVARLSLSTAQLSGAWIAWKQFGKRWRMEWGSGLLRDLSASLSAWRTSWRGPQSKPK